jgi:hypothetical protein
MAARFPGVSCSRRDLARLVPVHARGLHDVQCGAVRERGAWGADDASRVLRTTVRK